MARGQIIEPGQDTGQRPGKSGNVIGHNGDPQISEALRIPIGVDDQCAALRFKCRKDMGDKWCAAEHLRCLIGAAHARGASSSKDNGAS